MVGGRQLVKPNADPEILAVIPTLGRDWPRLAACVEAVRKQDADVRLAVVVVLNASDVVDLDGILDEDVSVLRPGFNLGWAGALIAARATTSAARRMWLVQDDMVADVGCLRAEIAELDADDGLALVSPLALTPAGLVAAATCGGYLRWEPEPELVGWAPTSDVAVADLGDLGDLGYVASRGMLVELDDWDATGGMHAGYYPVVWADVDFCVAVRARGRRFALARKAFVHHEGGGSTPSLFGTLLLERHRQLFAQRWGTAAGPPPRPTSTPITHLLVEDIARAASSLAGDLAQRYAERAERVTALEEQLTSAVAIADSARREVAELHASTSWRLTAPLRAVGRLLRRR